MINIIPTLTVMDTVAEYKSMIQNYISSGSGIFRCNATRFTNDVYLESIRTLRSLYLQETGRQFELLLDIPCPKDKYRAEYMAKVNQIQIDRGRRIKIVFTREQLKEDNMLYAGRIGDYDFPIGGSIIIGDGDVLLKVTAVCDGYIECIAENQGEIGYKKAVYFGDQYCHIIDGGSKENYLRLIELLKPEYIALSFVESPDEVLEIREQLQVRGINAQVISKIESQKAMEHLEDIIKVSDGALLGRGDLALSSGYACLPVFQKQFFSTCSRLRCRAYIATDILNSLTSNNFPSRAEVCDLYYLLCENAENIILSGPLCRYEKYLKAVELIRDAEKAYERQVQREGGAG